MKDIWKIFWPSCLMAWGMGLVIDNWGHNHPTLIFVGGCMHVMSLSAFIREIIRLEKRRG